MDKNKYSTIRVAIIFLAIASVVLSVVHILKLSGSAEETPQADLSQYGTETDYGASDELIYDDDSTVEMESIPNDAVVSGADVSAADVPEETVDAE